MNAHLKFTIDDCTILDEFYEPVGKNRRKFYYIMTPYGTCKVRADSFKKGFVPRITTALDKNEYFRKMCYKSFGDDNDDLSEINFITAKINIKVIDIYKIVLMLKSIKTIFAFSPGQKKNK